METTLLTRAVRIAVTFSAVRQPSLVGKARSYAKKSRLSF